MVVLIWLLLSSFLFCSALRYPLKNKPSKSRCDSCHHPLKPKHMIPLLSFILLKGKCAYCHQSIEKTNFIAELFGLMIGLIMSLYSHSWLAHLIIMNCFYLFFTDYLHHLIPDRIHLFFILINVHRLNIVTVLIMLIIGLCLLPFVNQQLFGMGDVKLMISSTIHLNLIQVNWLILCASLLSIILILGRKKAQSEPFPFGCSWAVCYLLLNHLV